MPVANAAAVVAGTTGYLIGGHDGARPVPSVTTFRLVPATAAIPPVTAGVTTTAGQAGLPSPILTDAPWLAPAHGRGHLAGARTRRRCPGTS